MNIKNKKHHHRPLGFYGSVWHNPKNYRNFAIGLSAFLLSFIAISLFAPVSNSSAEQQVLASITDGEYSVAVTGEGTVNLDLGQPSPTGKTVKAADNLSISANTPSGYKLYVSMDNALAGGNRLYKNGNTSAAYIAPNQNSSGQDIPVGSETTLADNSWGFTTDATKYNNNQFAAMPLSSNVTKISEQTSSGNYNLPIYYGVKANLDMISGNYSGNIVYTITSEDISDVSGIQSITPSEVGATGGESINITVKLFSSSITDPSQLGTITTTIAGTACPITNTIISNGDLIITCTTPALAIGIKTVSVSISRYGQTYEDEITYEVPPDPMQSFTASDCANMTTSTASTPVTVTLKDTRDSTKYRVSKLADGNCWMVDNLALNGTTNGTTPRTLTPADSDVASNYTFPSGVDITVGTSSVNTTPQIVTRDKEKTDNNIKYGNYYNFLAATAGWGTTSINYGNSPQSVCPKGWKLPVHNGDKSYYNLLTTNYGVTGRNVWTTIRNAPFYFPAAGYYSSNMQYQGSYGYYWSRMVNATNDAYDLYFYSDYYYALDSTSKYRAHSVRCVFNSSTPAMQNFTTQDCTNLTLSTSSVDNRILLRDIRDGTEYKVAKLADGNCWMVDNLALNGTTDGTTPRTLTPADSDVTSNYTFPSGVDISVGTSSSDATPQIITRDKNNTDNGIKYGNYYNFLAATAGWGTTSVSSGDTTKSICPKGWKLPAYSDDKSFKNLGSRYSITASNALTTIRNAPLYFPAAGRYNSGVSDQGSDGDYWSRRVFNANYAHYLFFNRLNYIPQDYYNKYYGRSVRCVFGG